MIERKTTGRARLDVIGGRSRISGGTAERLLDMLELEESEDPAVMALDEVLAGGTVIDGKYRIEKMIGRGGMGIVFSATHLRLGGLVALKFLNVRGAEGGDAFRIRFQREAQVSARLRNEHIARVTDIGMWRAAVPFMVMDHLNGTNLRRVLKDKGRLPLATARDYILQICDGLAEAHSLGIVHRDLKPSNIFVTARANGTDLIKILDFGISKIRDRDEEDAELTGTGIVLGSPKYMAPEQVAASATVDARADVWSIGALFYEMLTGRQPYDGTGLTRAKPAAAVIAPPSLMTANVAGVTPALDALVQRCLAANPALRVQSVNDLARELTAATVEESATTRDASSKSEAPRAADDEVPTRAESVRALRVARTTRARVLMATAAISLLAVAAWAALRARSAGPPVASVAAPSVAIAIDRPIAVAHADAVPPAESAVGMRATALPVDAAAEAPARATRPPRMTPREGAPRSRPDPSPARTRVSPRAPRAASSNDLDVVDLGY